MTKVDEEVALAKAKQAISLAMSKVVEAVSNYETLLADTLYQEAFNDGVAWVKGEFSRIANENAEDELPKSVKLSDNEAIAQNAIIDCISNNPGLRSSDITRKIAALPFKPALHEDVIRIIINRLKFEEKIVNKSGRWYSTAKSKVPDYQVMTYLPDGSKYLGSDVLR